MRQHFVSTVKVENYFLSLEFRFVPFSLQLFGNYPHYVTVCFSLLVNDLGKGMNPSLELWINSRLDWTFKP